MEIVATIAEYNPLHTGHIHQLNEAKKSLKPDAYAIVMSGNYTQRGDIGIVEKHKRAEAAVKAGADIVLELPVFYAVNCAERFAQGAMKVLSCFDANVTLSFGSESGDLKSLEKLSHKVHNENDCEKALIKRELDNGSLLVKARAKALNAEAEFKPNNILALEYIRYAKNYNFKCHTVKRENNFSSDKVNGKFASSNAIRNAIYLGNIKEIKQYLPDFMIKSLNNCIFNDSLTDMLLYKLNSMNNEQIANLYEVIEGLENRIKTIANEAKTYDELCFGIKSKRYTMARIKRILLYSLFDLDNQTIKDLYDAPSYARVLAVKSDRKDLLTALSAKSKLIVREKDLSNCDTKIIRAIELENRADKIYSVCSKQPTVFNAIFVD